MSMLKQNSQFSLVRRLPRGKPSNQGWKSGQRMFSRQHLMASAALVPAFDQRHPDCLNRFPTMRLREFSTMPDPTGRPRFRQRS